eukprot:595257-Hanusia_phi.AAC.2
MVMLLIVEWLIRHNLVIPFFQFACEQVTCLITVDAMLIFRFFLVMILNSVFFWLWSENRQLRRLERRVEYQLRTLLDRAQAEQAILEQIANAQRWPQQGNQRAARRLIPIRAQTALQQAYLRVQRDARADRRA